MSSLDYLELLKRRGVLPGTSGHGATTWTDLDDFAAAARVVLTEPTRRGGAGEEARSAHGMVMQLADVARLGRDDVRGSDLLDYLPSHAQPPSRHFGENHDQPQYHGSERHRSRTPR